MKRRIAVLVFLAVFCVHGLLLAAETQEVTGAVSEVIVYRGQAQVTRRIEVELGAGGSEIIVGELPEQLIADSLNAQGSGEVSISSVRYREKKAEEDTREEVKGLETQIEGVRRELKHAEKDIEHFRNLWNRYDPFWRLTMDVANKDFDRALLDAEPIVQLTTSLEAKSTELHERTQGLEDLREDLQKELGELERQLNELRSGRSRVEREAVLLVNSPRAGKAVIRLNYLVNGANWLAQYNLRAEPEKGMLRWDLELAANTTDEKAKIVTYSYSMKYDNDMGIQSVPVVR